MAPANLPVESSLVGAILSRRFRLVREIGRGGMGAVYAAEPIAGGVPVAVKILHPFFVQDPQVLTRFLDEGKTCLRLVHPNILRVHECLLAEDGTPYLVMELLEGVPLSAYTKDGGRVALGHAVPILQGMLAGLEGAHATGVVHRDLKPGNVFLARDRSLFGVKLLDFGIAKVMDAAGGMGTKTRTGALLGTPAYMSPEQVKSAKDVDGRSDLWSAGVMFYEMLSGRVAFAAPTEYARLAAVLSAQPVPIESLDPELAPVGPFLERALAKDRDRRFQTAREMSDAVAQLVQGRPPESTNRPAFTITASQDGRTPTPPPPPRDRSAWSLVADKTPYPAPPELPTLASSGEALTREVLAVSVLAGGHGSTLASPQRDSAAPHPLPPTLAAPAVVVVPTGELPAVARIAPAAPRTTSGVPYPVVFGLLAVALAIGFTLGVFYGR